MFAICNKILLLNVIDGNGKLTLKLKYKGAIYKRNHNLCFRIFVFTICSTYIDNFKINANNVID